MVTPSSAQSHTTKDSPGLRRVKAQIESARVPFSGRGARDTMGVRNSTRIQLSFSDDDDDDVYLSTNTAAAIASGTNATRREAVSLETKFALTMASRTNVVSCSVHSGG